MTPEEREHFEGLIVKAVQSGKKETSDLVADIINRIDPIVDRSIEKYVNGKIRRLDEKVDAYIESSGKWRAGADEKLSLVNNIQGFGRVFMYIVGVIVAIGTVWKIFK